MKNEKIKSVSYNNRKKQLSVVYQSGKSIDIHYGSVGIKNAIRKVWIDRETRGRSIGICFDNGQVDFIPYDQPLAVAKDPEFLLQTQIEQLTAKINAQINKEKISKRYLAEQLKTSDNQIQRLLNPKILNKNLQQLFHIASILTLDLRLTAKKAA